MQSPIGQVPVMGLDPGFRTGCKLAVVDGTGRVVATDVIYPVEPKARVEEAAAKVVELARLHRVHAVAIGNGTASRETELFARQAVLSPPIPPEGAVRAAALDKVIVAIVPETGASVYSASAVAPLRTSANQPFCDGAHTEFTPVKARSPASTGFKRQSAAYRGSSHAPRRPSHGVAIVD
jgi:transcriptional accessory protein Tex/SPT6